MKINNFYFVKVRFSAQASEDLQHHRRNATTPLMYHTECMRSIIRKWKRVINWKHELLLSPFITGILIFYLFFENLDQPVANRYENLSAPVHT